MGKSPLILAALAKDAAPALNFTRAETIGSEDGAISSTLLTDTDGKLHVIKMPRTQNAGVALDTELNAIRAFNSAVRERMPFEIAHIEGETRDGFGKRAVLLSYVYGMPIDLTAINGNDPLVASIAKSLAAIHGLPNPVVENAGMPEYSPADVVRLRTNELDRAAETGKVPSVLLSRWENALADVSLFKFLPTVIHADMHGDHVLESEDQVSGILEWGNLQIGDPAADFAWIVGSQNHDVAYAIMLEYQALRPNTDSHLKQRAELYGELELARWLLHGVKTRDETTIIEAVGMLEDLALRVEANEVPSLSTAPIPEVSAVQFESVTPHFESGQFETPQLETAAIPVIETSATAAEAPQITSDRLSEAEFAQIPVIDEGEAATYEATPTAVLNVVDVVETVEGELPAKKDDELF
ncbi:MAG: hypothetical protein RL556_607 [Actinomycetota bacterium]